MATSDLGISVNPGANSARRAFSDANYRLIKQRVRVSPCRRDREDAMPPDEPLDPCR